MVGVAMCPLQARVLNPLLPMDFHNDIRVHVVPETEEFIKRIGHMATEEDIMYLQVGDMHPLTSRCLPFSCYSFVSGICPLDVVVPHCAERFGSLCSAVAGMYGMHASCEVRLVDQGALAACAIVAHVPGMCACCICRVLKRFSYTPRTLWTQQSCLRIQVSHDRQPPVQLLPALACLLQCMWRCL